MRSLRKILNRVRIAVMILLITLNFISVLIIASEVGDIPFVWVTFLGNFIFLAMMAYTNGWMYGMDLWWRKEMKDKGYTCTDCVKKNRCMDRSRNYCCTSFMPREEKKDEDHEDKTDGNDMGADRRSYQFRNIGTGGQDQRKGL